MESISGQILALTYTDPESGFTVARMKPETDGDPVTVVGALHAPAPGEFLEMEGEWIMHPRFGRQFQVSAYRHRIPVTPESIRRYLGSGLIKGIGPEMARRIVDSFGVDTLDVIDHDTGRLVEVNGIGSKRAAMISTAWQEHRRLREAMLFFQEHGMGTGQILRIFKRYGDQSIAAVNSNPYRLADEIRGIGFLKADRIAAKLGIPRTSPLRIESGVLHALGRWAEDGHVFCPMSTLVEKALGLLDVSAPLIGQALDRLTDRGRIVTEVLQDTDTDRSEEPRVYLAGLHRSETGVARALLRLLQEPSALPSVDPDRAITWVQDRLHLKLASRQKKALQTALSAKVLVITGGPGTGKTTIINALLKIAEAKHVAFCLAAPTGRAAKRMAETTGHSAATLHRLLEFNPRTGLFQRNATRPLKWGLLIVDEASMMDTVLAGHLLDAVSPEASMIFVGDIHQLPSVGPGNVLGDVIASGAVPVVELTDIFRQARKSRIVVNAHQINAGIMPTFDADDTESDCYFIQREDPEAVVELIVHLASRRIHRLGFHPINDIQILTPMNRGPVGTVNLNRRLQEALNPVDGSDAATRGMFRSGDKVMQVRNNYTKEVFNGDIGRIVDMDTDSRSIRVDFDGHAVTYETGELDDLVLAYAISVHKSQGSEFPAVVFPVLTQHYMLLQRNLIYTAITRGKRLAVVVGTRKALAMGIRNAKGINRCTGLRDRLSICP